MVEKRKYDLVMAMGVVCACSQALRTAGLQYTSLPFDWNAGRDLRLKVDMMVDGCAGWLKRESFVKVRSTQVGVTDHWEDDRGFWFTHDFTEAGDLDRELSAVQEKYARRVERMEKLLSSVRRVLLVCIEMPGWPEVSPEDFAYCRETLGRKWPDVTFDLLNLKYRAGVAFANRTEREENGLRVVSFDYKDSKEEGWRIDYRRVGKWLATEYEAVDFRTEAEKEAWRKAVAGHEYGRYHVTNFWDYLYTKLRYKIYRHLVKDLQRKGVI